MKLNEMEQRCLDVLEHSHDWVAYPELVRLTGLDSLAVSLALNTLLDYRLIEEGVIDQTYLKVGSISYFRAQRYRSIGEITITED